MTRPFRLTILAVLALILIAPPALAQPALPHYFYGALRIDGVDAPAGTRVEAMVPGVMTGPFNPIVTTQAGRYGDPNPSASVPRLLVQGNIASGSLIEFYVNGRRANQTAAWRAGQVEMLDLTVRVSPTPTPTPVTPPPPLPTPTPTPPTPAPATPAPAARIATPVKATPPPAGGAGSSSPALPAQPSPAGGATEAAGSPSAPASAPPAGPGKPGNIAPATDREAQRGAVATAPAAAKAAAPGRPPAAPGAGLPGLAGPTASPRAADRPGSAGESQVEVLVAPPPAPELLVERQLSVPAQPAEPPAPAEQTSIQDSPAPAEEGRSAPAVAILAAVMIAALLLRTYLPRKARAR